MATHTGALQFFAQLGIQANFIHAVSNMQQEFKAYTLPGT